MAADTETVDVRADAEQDVVAGRYVPIRLLGRGGSKEVYLAWDLRLEREIALALVVVSGDPAAVYERVLRESRLTARLGDHPHVVTVHDAGQHDDVPFLVTRHMEGGSLAGRLAREPDRRLPWSTAATLVAEVADALSFAHQRGVVHRDVKPDNIWLDARGAAALGDFGIAQVDDVDTPARPPGLVGTALYLSPEQAMELAVDWRADLYALGVTLYELVAGRPPFEGGDTRLLAQRHIHEAPPPLSSVRPEIPSALDELAGALLAKAPAGRPESAAAVRDVLRALAAPAPQPSQLGPSSELVGREDVMARLRAASAAAMTTGPAVLAIAGEPGAGKTRVAETLAAWVSERGTQVHWARCLEGSDVRAYLVWRQVLPGLAGVLARSGAAAPVIARLAPLLGREQEASAPTDRDELFDAVASVIASATADEPHMLVVDNLHWADRTSLELLRHVACNVPRARLAIVGTYRPSAAGEPEQPIESLLADLGCHSVELPGLDEHAVRRLAGMMLGRPAPAWLVRDLHARTRGNPFFVTEVARGLARIPALAGGRRGAEQLSELIPQGVRELVLGRMARLSGGAREVLRLGAVIGESFDATALARASGRSRPEVWDALDEARRAGLVEETPDAGRRFSHAIVRDVVYHDIAASARAAMHRSVATVLEQDVGRGVGHPTAELARHLLIAARRDGDAGRAADYCERAGAAAEELQAHAEAAGLYADALEALDLIGREDLERRARLLVAHAEALTAAGDVEASHAPFEEAAALARQAGAVAVFARAALGRAAYQHYGIVDEQAIDLLREALELLPDRDTPDRAAVLGRLALRLDADDEQLTRERILDEAISMARRTGRRDVLVALHGITPLVNWRPERTAVRRAGAAEAIRLASGTGNADIALWAQISLFCDALDTGDLEAAEAELDAYADAAGRSRLGWHRRYALVMRATLGTFRGDLARSRLLVDEAQELDREQGEDAGQEFCVQRLVLAKLRARPEEAEAELLRAFAARYTRRPLWQALLAMHELEVGRSATARRALARCVPDGPGRLPSNRDALVTLAILGEVAARLGDVPWTAEAYRLLLPHRARNAVADHGWAAWGAVARPLGLLAARLDQEVPAREHFAQALDLHSRWGARPWLLQTIADMLECLPDARRDDALIRRGVQLAREIGAPPVERRVARLRG